ncbi:hypothetical protein [Iodobacter fluviatilis]|uniref:Uncharacterized protein n=1 Tax=Iodobacter fluviatilis TaxID=537 RepID=A0A377Q399_9NEIS|nr:hypothetical protein [Iodobacter fluviatilis]TCU90260.1 hypothetical protein EV682_101285 [Iodobacter fluviatilis]STQ89287.1 Uncharacterised protein [Iodobacter fluviatilis]
MLKNTIKPDNTRPMLKPETKPVQPVSFDQDGFASHDGVVPCFCHDTRTLEYIGKAEMWVSKDCGLPAGAVQDAPKVRPAKNKAIIRNKADQCWALIEDYRKMIAYQTSDGAARVLDTLGPIPEGFTLLPYFEGAVWNGKKWITEAQPIPLVLDPPAAIADDQLLALNEKIERLEGLLAQVLSETPA